MNGLRRVVVTGMDAISPVGIGLKPFWAAVRDGHSAGEPITCFDVSRNRSRIAAHVKGFNRFGTDLPPAQAAHMDRVTQFAVVAARGAIRDSGLDIEHIDPSRAGVCIGTAIGGVGFMEREFVRVCKRNGSSKPRVVSVSPDLANADLYSGFLAHSVSGEVARDQGFCGVCTTMATGCTAGLDAIGLAFDLVASDAADVMITGGADAPITPVVLTAFDNISCLTRRNDSPRHASRPFDRERDGFLLAEGCGVLVVEAEGHARARHAEMYGRILSFASLSNAFHMTGLPPDGAALARTLRRALAYAAVPPDAVDYINAHGSSTPQNDRNETAAFKTVFGSRAYNIPISSTKSVVGHSLGAASALESIACLCSIANAVIPPTANYETADPDCDLDYVPNMARDARLNVVECNASGFSGIHSSILFSHSDYQLGCA